MKKIAVIMLILVFVFSNFFETLIAYAEPAPVDESTNHTPVITVIGSNPLNLSVGQTFYDSGAIAIDDVDGNITSDIVSSSTVNTDVAGTYRIVYSVTDSGGLIDTKERQVIVGSGSSGGTGDGNGSGSCDVNAELVVNGGFEYPVVPSGQHLYKFPFTTPNLGWTTYNTNPVGLEILASEPSSIIDPWVSHSGNQYNEIELGGANDISQNLPTVPGNTYSLSFWISPYGHHGPEINSANVYAGGQLLEHLSGIGGEVLAWEHHSLSFVATTTTTRLSFIDAKPGSSSLGMFLDDVSVKCSSSGNTDHTNTPPVITLLGSNPATVMMGKTYTDAGATAFDKEDLDITNKITTSSTVNTAVVGTYTVTYSVKDSQGLEATKTRQVIVTNSNDLSCKITSPDQHGWYGTYYNYTSTTTGMELPMNLWNTSYGDPLSKQSPWTANWYTDQFARFSRVDSTITFGDNFFPFDSSPEEIINGHDYHFGVHFSAKVTTATAGSYAYTLTSDDDSWVYVDGQLVADNKGVHIPITINNAVTLSAGSHIVDIFFAERHTVQSSFSFEFADKSLNIKPYSTICVEHNERPVITLIGANPATVTVGSTYTDPGATASDKEDGDLTSSIIASSTVNTAVVGTYAVTYNVKDSKGQSAVPVVRTVNVVPVNAPAKGKITFCLITADNQNNIATTSTGLPQGLFSINLATSTNISSSTIQSKTWNTTTFSPNQKTILNNNDSDCVTYSNLDLGNYYYSQLSVNGTLWNIAKYNDQEDFQAVNNVFDFFPYSTTSPDSDGLITLPTNRTDRTLVMYDTFNVSSTTNQIPVITLLGSNPASTTVGNVYTDAGATAMDPEDGDITSSIIASSTVNTTVVGTYTVTYNVKDSKGQSAVPVVRTVNVVPVVCTSNCGGGGGANANISAVKTVDKTTVNVGDNITYTITVKNSGPDLATGVKVTDTLPGGLNFISATSTFGSYSTTTSIWTIGSMANGSSTSLTIVASVKTGTEGQKITNSAVASADQTDSTPSDNTTSVDTTVNSPVCTSNCGGGGGGGTIGNGGGGGGGNGPIIPNNLTIFNEQVIETVPGIAMITWNTNLPATRRVVYSNTSHSTLGDAPNYGYDSSTDLVSTPLLTAHGVVVSIDPGKVYYFRAVSTDSAHSAVSKELQITRGTVVVGNGGITEAPSACYYLHDYLRKDFNNNPVEVKKLQIFLRDLEGFSNLQVTGVYDEATIAATDAFQIRYKGDVLTPWGYDGTKGTDYTYILTKKKVNEIYCKMAFPVTAQQQAEIDSTRNFFQSLRNEGININTQNTTQPAGNENNVPLQNNVVGQGPEPESTITPDLTTMAGISTTTNSITSRFTANVLYAGKNLVNLAFLPFLWPFSNTALSSACFPSFSGWLNIILILIILVILYMWYREYRNNRRIEDINKEIDLK